MKIKQKVKRKIQQMSIDIFSNEFFLEIVDCLFQFIQMKMFILTDLKLKGIIYENT